MLDYVYLQTFDFFDLWRIYVNRIYVAQLEQARLSSITIINIERAMQTTFFRNQRIESLIFLNK